MKRCTAFKSRPMLVFLSGIFLQNRWARTTRSARGIGLCLTQPRPLCGKWFRDFHAPCAVATTAAVSRVSPGVTRTVRPGVARIGESALLDALDARDEQEVARLLSGPAERVVEMLSARTNRGCTPLMMAAMGHCSEELMEQMLSFGPVAAGVALRSWKGLSAADFARLHHRRPGLIERLDQVDKAEVTRTAESRCPVCGVVFGRSRMEALVERCRRGAEESELVARFCDEHPDIVRALLQPLFHNVNSDKRYRKRLSRSVTMLDAIENITTSLENWHIIDLCCGKSLNAALLALRYPSATITAVDRVPDIKLPHYTEAGIQNVRYLQRDVFESSSFIDALVDETDALGQPVAVLGMHLCGHLSSVAADLFCKLRTAQVCVLSPCCLPHLDDAPAALAPLYRTGYTLRQSGRRNSHFKAVDDKQYQGWCDHLASTLRNSSRDVVVDVTEAPGMISIKRTLILARKSL